MRRNGKMAQSVVLRVTSSRRDGQDLRGWRERAAEDDQVHRRDRRDGERPREGHGHLLPRRGAPHARRPRDLAEDRPVPQRRRGDHVAVRARRGTAACFGFSSDPEAWRNVVT